MARQKLDWSKPKSFKTAASRLAKSYNAYVKAGYNKEFLEDQLQNLQKGLGYAKSYMFKDKLPQNFSSGNSGDILYNDSSFLTVFSVIYDVNKDGTLSLAKSSLFNVEDIYDFQSVDKVITKIVDGKEVEIKTRQTLRELYESTPTKTEYEQEIKKDVLKGYVSNPNDKVIKDKDYYRDTIKETVEALKENDLYKDKSDKELREHAKALRNRVQEAIYNEMAARAEFSKYDISEVDDLFKTVSEAIENDLFSGELKQQANALVHHDGSHTTYSDMNQLLGIYNAIKV